MQRRFLDFALDVDARSLTRNGQAVRLSPKAFDLLSLLVRERHRVVSRQELYDFLWPATFVVEGNLPVLVREIRTALGDTNHELVTTVHGTGYRFAAPIREPQAASAIDSVAVMPLVNRTGDPSLDYLGDGITDHVINRLMLVPDLRVMSRNATFRYKTSAVDVDNIARDLSVSAVMLGSLTRNEREISVTIELIDVAGRRLIFSRTYLRPEAELVSLPMRIAADVAEHLHADMDGVRDTILKPPTANAEAFRFYLQARQCMNRLDPMSLHESIRLNERAVMADPDFAAAYCDRGRAYMKLAIYFESPTDMMPLALKNVRRALDIDATLADAHINLGVIHLMYEWNWDAAERELFIASELHPLTAEAFSCASHVLESAGKKVNAEHYIRRGLVRDPQSVPLLTELGCNAYAHRRYDTAIDEFRNALRFDERNPVAYLGLGRAYSQKEMYADALSELQQVEKLNAFAPPVVVSEIGYVLGRSGKRREAGEVIDVLRQLSDKLFVDPYLLAVVHLGAGQYDEALTELEAACEDRSGFAVAVKSEPKWDPLRSHPRFASVLRRLNLHS